MDKEPALSFKYKKERFVETFSFFCQGCNMWHSVSNKLLPTLMPVYIWNGSIDRPSITPRIKNSKDGHVCNVSLTDGNITYLPNTTHHLKGRTLQL